MEHIFHPVSVITLSVFLGGTLRVLKAPRWAAYSLPPLLIFCAMSYAEFFGPYKGGGASFWPIGEIIASMAATVSGAVGYLLVGYLVKKK